jgi:hypothetical protein
MTDIHFMRRHRYAGSPPGPKGRVRFKNIFSPGGAQPAIPAAPTPTPPPTMPDFNSPSALEARRRAMVANTQGGRQSTILTTAANRGTMASGGYTGAKTGA